MPTCSQITDALNTLASATTNPNILADISGQTAVLSNIGTTETVVPFTAGGPAVLSAPASPTLDGVLFRVYIAGTFHLAAVSNNDFTASVRFGSITSPVVTIGQTAGSGSVNDGVFLFEFDCLWNSAAGRLDGLTSTYTSTTTGVLGGLGSGPVTTQTDIQFVVTGQFTGSVDPSNSFTVTQFKMQLV